MMSELLDILKRLESIIRIKIDPFTLYAIYLSRISEMLYFILLSARKLASRSSDPAVDNI